METINLIKKIRKQKRITLIELADELRVRQDYLVKVECGEIEVPLYK